MTSADRVKLMVKGLRDMCSAMGVFIYKGKTVAVIPNRPARADLEAL
jgi:hypothetical protein